MQVSNYSNNNKAKLFLWFYSFLTFVFSFFIILPGLAKVPSLLPYVIIVQPIVMQSDEGTEPASMALPEDLVDKSYENAGIDFYFLEPIYFNNTSARDGLINLDSICSLASDLGIMKGTGDIVNMFFINAVDGRKGPLGRGQMGGNITFIALGKKPNPAMEAFVLSHEVGHNLSLKHVVDDIHINDTIPNIMGGGEFSERIDPQYSLTPYQIEIIRKSPLVHPRTEILDIESGAKAIQDESYEPFFVNMQLKEICAFTGENVLDKSLDEARIFAREFFAGAVLDFTPHETEALNYVVDEVNHLLIENGLAFMANHPWRFIKVKSSLCGGFAYTRGTYIVLSEKHMNYLSETWHNDITEEEKTEIIKKIGSLIVHEQMHSIQRTFPSKFFTLYHDYWNFQMATVASSNDMIINQVSNPDAPVANWLVPFKEKENHYYWIRTLFKETSELPVMGKDFIDLVYEVEFSDNQYKLITDEAGNPKHFKVEDFDEYKSRFPLSRGLDHPNEISAYMFSSLFVAKLLNNKAFADISPEAQITAEQFIEWCSLEMAAH